ncbi:MAG: ATP-binding cassette domain-containing protein [Pseudomonadota bacterium]
MVRLEGAYVARGKTQMLGPVDLSLGREGVTVLIGPNGAGKTTLLKLLHGLEPPRDGQVHWDQELSQAFVFQRPVMLRRSVRENLALPLQLKGRAGNVEEMAERLGLSALLDTHAPRLSGGEAQKLALGRALMTAPDVLFLDEPTANLDGPTVAAIEDILLGLAQGGTRLILATHAMGQARRLATEVLWVAGGRVSGPYVTPGFFDAPPEEARAFMEAQA